MSTLRRMPGCVPQAIRYSLVLAFLFPSFGTCQAYGYHFFRTDVGPENIIYDAIHQQFFASVPAKNEIEVISGKDGSLLARINVPSPNGLDLSPDGSILFVSGIGDLPPYPVIDGFFAIDTTTFQVIRFLQSEAPFMDGGGFALPQFRSFGAMRNGKFFYDAAVSYNAYVPIFEYDLQTGVSIDTPGSSFSGHISKSANGARFVVTQYQGLQVYNGDTDRFSDPVPLPKDLIPTASASAIFNSDGTRILVNGHIVTDQYLNQMIDLWPNMDYRNCYSSAFSTDGSKVYCYGLPDLVSTRAVVRVFDSKNGAILGDVPAPSPSWPSSIAVSSTGLAVLTGKQGVVLLNVSTPAQGLGQSEYLIDTMTPQSSPSASPTPVVFQWLPDRSPAGSAYFFGALQGTVLQTGQSSLRAAMVTVQPPSATAPAAVDVSIRTGDGSAFYAPEAYSYGPVIVSQDIGAGPAAGGTKVHLSGYGFGVMPTVTVGGAAATITDVRSAPKISTYAFPTQQLEFITPPGPTGPADIILTTPNGAVTKRNGYLYLPHSQVPGLQPVQMVLDERRHSLYVADAASGDVKAVDTSTLSVSTLINMSAGPATGLALMPDGGKLLAISYQARTLTVYDLNARAVLKTFVPTPGGQTSVSQCDTCPPGTASPNTVAGTARGTALVGLAFDHMWDVGMLYEVNLDTGATVDLGPGLISVSWEMLLAPSADGSKIYIANSGLYGTSGGYLSLWDSALGAVTWRRNISLADVIDLSPSASGDRVYTGSFTYSRRLDQLTVLAPMQSLQRVFGQKMNMTGSLLYIPTTSGVQIYDVHRGDLRLSVGVPGGVQIAMDGMVIDQTGTTIYLAEAAGLGIIRLPAAPLSISEVAYSAGVRGIRGPGRDSLNLPTLSIQGSGFQENATVSIGATVERGDVLSSAGMTVPAPVVHGYQKCSRWPCATTNSTAATPFGIPEEPTVTVTNPDGDTYRLQAAYDPNEYPAEPLPVLSAVSTPAPGVKFVISSLAISGRGFLASSEVYIDGISVQTAFIDS
jgi:YVTN family beta-propeller protein